MPSNFFFTLCILQTHSASHITCLKPGQAAESALTEIENIWHSLHTSSAEISENLITENDMLLEEIPELLVDDDETKTNNNNFEPPPEPCKLFVSLMKKNCNLCDSCIHNNFKLTRNHEMLLLKSTE